MKGFSAPSEGIYSLWCRLPLLWPQGHPWFPFQVTKQCSTHKSSVRRVLSDQRPSFIRHLWYPQPTGQAETAGRKASEKGNLCVCVWGVPVPHTGGAPAGARIPAQNTNFEPQGKTESWTFKWNISLKVQMALLKVTMGLSVTQRAQACVCQDILHLPA